MSFVAGVPSVFMEAGTDYSAAMRWWRAFRMHEQTHQHGVEASSRPQCIVVPPGEHLVVSAYLGLSKLVAIPRCASGWNPPLAGCWTSRTSTLLWRLLSAFMRMTTKENKS